MELKKEEFLELFYSSVHNAHHLYTCAQKILETLVSNKFPSLGLAELALEELGKSYTCLAMYRNVKKIEDWKIFWKEWRDHDLKAHRAFFYEFFSLLRIDIEYDNPENALPFPSARGKFSKEKEASFYVDIDKSNRKIHKPENEITDEECVRRVTSLMGLFNTVFYIKDWIAENSDENFHQAISDFAYRTITTDIYQQDVLNVLDQMKNGNAEYENGLGHIKKLFDSEYK